MRATPAMIRADSILNTASTESVGPDAVTTAHQSSGDGVEQVLPGSHFCDLAELGGDGPVLRMDLQEPLGPLDGLGLVLGLEDGVTTDDFLALREGPVLIAELAVSPGDAGALGSRGEPGRVQHDPGLRDL